MNPLVVARPGLLEALADALRARVLELSRADQQRAAFVFHEHDGSPPRAGSTADVAWTAHLARALQAACEPSTLDLLSGLRHGDRTLDEIALTARPRGDRLAAGAWIGDLAAAGLVGRDLETDRVALAPLGLAVIAVIDAVAALAAGTSEPTETTEP